MMGTGMGKKHGMGMEKAKEHYEALMAALAAIGMTLAEFEEKMNGGEEMEEEEEGYEDEGESSEEEMKTKADKAKVALIVARMKGKEK